MSKIAAAWLADPTGRHQHRYWDGSSWTEHVSDAGAATTDAPLYSAPSGGSAAWYADPSGRHQHRYWDGVRWTSAVADAGVQAEDSPSLRPPSTETRSAAPATSAAATSAVVAAQSQGASPETSASPVGPLAAAGGTEVARRAFGSQCWPPHSVSWCRACGHNVAASDTVCSQCQWPLITGPSRSDHLGVVYELRGKVGLKTQAICVSEQNGQLELYASPKHTEVVAIPAAVVSKHARQSLSVAGRMYAALGDARANRFRSKWDLEVLAGFAWAWANRTTGDLRALADEALEFGWHDLFASLPLSSSERAWRMAHHASSLGDIAALLVQARQLPPHGYANRCGLLAPHLTSIRSSATREWLAVLDSWDSALPGVTSLRALLGSEQSDLSLLEAAQRDLLNGISQQGRPKWEPAIAGIASGTLHPAPYSPAPEWQTYRWYLAGGAPEGPVEPSRLGAAMLDDLVDAGGVTSADGAGPLTNEQRFYIQARTSPGQLEVSQLRSVGHHGELARRYFLERDVSALRALPPDPDVEHYLALAQFVDGGEPSEALRSESRSIIETIAKSRAAIEGGDSHEIPDALAGDPTTWVTFRELALAGRISCSPEQRLRFPRFGNWVDLHGVLQLIWSGRWAEADELGRSVAPTIDDEVMQDEVLSLRAFALHQLGRPADALSCLESALAGRYTEALLINTGIAARDADPSVATRYFTRLINEAPTIDLQVAAMRSAVNVWGNSPDLHLPQETSDALRRILANDLEPDVYLDFIRMASRVDAERLAKLPPPRPRQEPNATVHDFFTTRAGFFGGDKTLVDLADKLVEAGRNAKGADWHSAELNEFTKAVWDLLSVDFGEAWAAALAAERLVRGGRDLLTPGQYFFFALQSGAHQATFMKRQENRRLNHDDRQVLFFAPVEEFRVERKDLPPGLVDFLADNFGLCLRVFLANDYDAARGQSNVIANEYNTLQQRLNWDTENRFAIRRRLIEILDLDQTLIDDLRRTEERCNQFPHNEGGRALLNEISNALRDWQSEVVRLRARF